MAADIESRFLLSKVGKSLWREASANIGINSTKPTEKELMNNE